MAGRSITASSSDWKRVADAVVARRQELGLTAGDAIARAGRGLSLTVLSLIENVRQDSYAQRTLAALSRALGWTPDSIERIVAGGEPVIVSDPPRRRPAGEVVEEIAAEIVGRFEAAEARLAELDADIAAIVEDVGIDQLPTLARIRAERAAAAAEPV